jgi:hypothetical protein
MPYAQRMICQSGTCLIAWQGPTPVAQIAWDAVALTFILVREVDADYGGGQIVHATSKCPSNNRIGRLICVG